jgi:hypothetical protein
VSELPGDLLNESLRERRPVPEFETEITERPRETAAPFRQQTGFATAGAAEAYPVVTAAPETDCIDIASLVSAENLLIPDDLLAAAAAQFDPVAAGIKYLTSSQEIEASTAVDAPGDVDLVLPKQRNRIRVGPNPELVEPTRIRCSTALPPDALSEDGSISRRAAGSRFVCPTKHRQIDASAETSSTDGRRID